MTSFPKKTKSHTNTKSNKKTSMKFAAFNAQKKSDVQIKPTKKPATKPHFYGIHAVNALLKHRPLDALALFIQEGNQNSGVDEIVTVAKNLGVAVQFAQKNRLDELCGSPQHQGVVLSARMPALADEADLVRLLEKSDALFLVLDQITDAHNLGACLRTASAMGVDAVILPKNQSATITPTVAKVSVGASEVVPVISVTNLARTLEMIKKAGVFVFGTALDETAVLSECCDFSGKVAIVMGSEGDGMRRLTATLCDTLVMIPMANNPDRPQSLNVSVATGMMLYEVTRQRRLKVDV
ncbi:MAG: 23S rRNA (guanosine(2251)-2'-O)-methyltransferase RlmB [Moraxella sp.]|nr:23S rRNA (guanosine(2251)-2'-O)-methyltransferase RlmB [Moraxella sp.]